MAPVRPFRPMFRAGLTANALGLPVAVAAAVAGAAAYTLYSRTVHLESSELVNHDTKRLRFALPDPKQSTGLSLTSAVLTISWAKGSWLPTIRPYTPVNNIGTSRLLPSNPIGVKSLY